jgi:peptidyl-prolyl cis-trans isomerase C
VLVRRAGRSVSLEEGILRITVVVAVTFGLWFAAFGARADEPIVVARVNGTPITEAQVQELSRQMQQAEPEMAAQSAESLREGALQSLIDMQLLTEQAKAEKIEATSDEVDQQFNRLKSQYPTPEAFQEALATNHASEPELRKEIASDLVIQKLLDRHVSVKLAPGAAEKFYKENKDKFQRPAEVRASHILFRAASEGDTEAAKKRAADALERLKKGEDFAKLAKELSEDTGSAENDGDLGFFAQEGMVKPFADAAFGLKKGELSGVVQTEFGFHLIKVTDTHPAGVMALADVKPQIESYLQEQERQARAQAYVAQLKKKAKIEIVAAKTEPAKESGASSQKSE